MVLPEGHGLHPGHPHLRGYIRFLNLDTGTFVRAHLPLFSDHCVVDSVDGLLVLLRDQDSAVRLVHPFTVDIVELPPLASVLPDIGVLDSFPAPYRIKRLADSICASVSFSGVAITVMLALHEAYHIVFATPLDQQWTLSPWGYSPGWTSPFSFQGKLYTVNRVGLSRESEFTGEWESFGDIQVFQIDPPVNDGMGSGSKLQLPKLIATLPEGNLDEPMGLVECDSEILVVGYKDFSMLQFAVFKLTDLIQQRYIPITSIGGNTTLFISERSLSVAPKALPTPMGDSVICLEPTQHNPVHQHLNSVTWSPATDDCSMYGPAPGPCSLIYVIFNCCRRNRWNKGQIFGKYISVSYGAA